MFLLLSAFELISLGLLLPFVNFAVNGSLQIQTVSFFEALNQYIATIERPVFVLGLVVLIVFVIKFRDQVNGIYYPIRPKSEKASW